METPIRTTRQRWIVWVAVLGLVLSTFALSPPAEAEGDEVEVWLTLIHNNDGESALLEVTNDIDGLNYCGAAPFARLVMDLKRAGRMGDAFPEKEVSFVVSSGDNYLASAAFQASLEKGPPFYDTILMDRIGYAAMAIGNHEFDFGPDVLEDFISGFQGREQFVTSNLDFSQEPGLDAFVTRSEIVKSTVVDARGEKFGIVGATTEGLASISSPRDVIINEVLPAVQAEIANLEAQGVDKIIMISHLQSINEDIDLAAQLSGIDVMVAGGGDELLANPDDLLVPGHEGNLFGPYPMIATNADGNDVPVVTTSGGYCYAGHLVVGFDADGEVVEIHDSSGPKRVTSARANPDATPPDRVTQARVVDPVAAFVDSLATTVVAQTEVPLNSARGVVDAGPPLTVLTPGERVSDTNLGNLAADAMLWQATELAATFGTPIPDIAFQNGGGIRQPDAVLFPGATPGSPEDVTRLDIRDQFPFPNFVSVLEDVPLSQIKVVLENAVSNVENVDGRFAHPAGMTMTWDSTGTPNVDRVKTITVGATLVYDESAGGWQVPETDTVNVATIDFLARGGDDYDFGGLPFASLGVTYEQAVVNYITDVLGGVITDAMYPNIENTRMIQVG